MQVAYLFYNWREPGPGAKARAIRMMLGFRRSGSIARQANNIHIR
jgi:hypothetical protein